MKYKILSYTPRYVYEHERKLFDQQIQNDLNALALKGWKVISVVVLGMTPYFILENETQN